AGLPDVGAVYWGQLFAIWLHAGLPAPDEQWMERELRDLVARSNLSVAHAAALVQIEAAHGAAEQARGRLDELVGTGLGTMRPDMLYPWALTLLARDVVVLRAAHLAPRVHQALIPYARRATDAVTRVPDSLGLRYLDLLIRHPGRELAALDLIRLTATADPAAAASEDGLHDASRTGADEVLDRQARTAYRRRLAGLDEELAE